MGKIDITTDVERALCKRGMAWVDKKGQFHLNRKGRRWLEKQVGRRGMRVLQTETLRRAEADGGQGTRKRAWKDAKKLDS